MKILLILITSFLSISSIAQLQDSADSIKVSFEFPSTVAKDSNDLTFKIVFHNRSKKTAFAYATLVHGKLDDEDCNLNVVVQKYDGRDYKNYPLGYYHKMSETKTDTICRDVAKRALQPLSTDTLSYNLLRIGNYFEPGKYRFKARLRKRCKIILPRGEGDTWHSEINYTESKWFYFQAPTDITKNVAAYPCATMNQF